MLPDWEANHVLFSDLLPSRHSKLFRCLTKLLTKHNVSWHIVAGTADIWMRDYAPVQVGLGEFVQFRYEPDYLRSQHEELRTKPDAFLPLEQFKKTRPSKLIVDGGNLVTNGEVAIVTDKVFSENPKITPRNIRGPLQKQLRCRHLIVIPQEPGDVFGHSDGIVRFLNHQCVVMNDYSSVDPDFGRQLKAKLHRHGLRIKQLPYVPSPRIQDGINSARGNYVNFLRVGQLIVLPQFGLVQDKLAVTILKQLLPDQVITSIQCRELADEGGVLNCITATINVNASPGKDLKEVG